MAARLRAHLPFLLLLAVAAVVRFWGLGWLPSPAGDEGNWTLYGYRLLHGRQPRLAPDAAFVSLLYAHLIALSMKLVGTGFVAARLVNGLGLLGALVMAYAVPTALGSRRAGLAAAGLLAVHPWSVAYSRISSVPYALALGVMTSGTLLFVYGLSRRRVLWIAVAIQVLAVGAHFSPLCVVAPLACLALAARRQHAWIFGRFLTYASGAVAALHVIPVVRQALGVAATAPELDIWSHFGTKLLSYLHMVFTGLAGEATLRHFTNQAIPARLATLTALPVVALIGAAWRSRVRGKTVLLGMGPLYFAVALLVTPLILAPAREWDMPATHMDRYLFAILPGLAFSAADLLSEPFGRAAELVGSFVGWLSLCTLRLALAFLVFVGVDHGEMVAEGGSGHRGWLVSDRPQATVEQIRDTALDVLGPEGGAVLYADRTFTPLLVTMQGTAIAVRDVRRTFIPRHPAGRYLVVLWPDSVLSLDHPPTAPPKYVAANRHLRARMHAKFGRVTLVKSLRQRDGKPLIELWLAEQPLKRRLRQDF